MKINIWEAAVAQYGYNNVITEFANQVTLVTWAEFMNEQINSPDVTTIYFPSDNGVINIKGTIIVNKTIAFEGDLTKTEISFHEELSNVYLNAEGKVEFKKTGNEPFIPTMSQDAIWKCFGKIVAILLLVLFYIPNSYAQGGFLRTYPKGANSNEYMAGLIQYPDSSYLASVWVDTLQYWFLDKEGHITSKKNMQVPGNKKAKGGSFLPISDGNYLASGYCTSKITPMGDTIWNKCGSFAYYIQELPNKNFASVNGVLSTCTNTDDMMYVGELILVAADGVLLADTLWTEEKAEFDDCWTSQPTALVANNEQAFIVTVKAAGINGFVNNYVDVRMVSLTNFGEILWRHTDIPGTAYDAVGLNDGSFLVAMGTKYDTLKIVKYLKDGTMAWNKIVGSEMAEYFSNLEGDTKFLKSDRENEYILTFTDGIDIIGIDSSANVLWKIKTKAYGAILNKYPDAISFKGNVLWQDGRNYLIAVLFYDSSNNSYIPYLARVDSLGNCAPYSQFTLTQTDSLVTLTNTSFGGDTYKWVMGNGDTLLNQPTTTTYIYPTKGVYQICLVAENLCGKNQHCQTINYGSVGINNTTITPINISQTANNEVIIGNLSQTPILSVKLYNSCGQLMYHQEAPNSNNGSYTLTTHHLPPGLYQVIAQTSQGMGVGKVVVW